MALRWNVRFGIFLACVATAIIAQANPRQQIVRPNFSGVVSTFSIRHIDVPSGRATSAAAPAQLLPDSNTDSSVWYPPVFSESNHAAEFPFPVPFRNFVSYVNAYATTPQQSLAAQAALMLLLDGDDDSNASLYQYDANGRLTMVSSLGGGARSYNYDALGNLLTVASTANTLTLPSPNGAGTSPSITGFSPGGGGVGTSVTVSGSGFLPVAGQTIVSLGGTVVTPSTLTDSQIVFAVPANQGTAPIRIVTPYGSAASGNFNVPINGVTLTNTVALATGGSAQTLTLSAANTSAAFSFQGQVNGWMSLQLSALSVTPSGASVSYSIYNPNNQSIATGTVASNWMSVHAPPLPATGTYLVVFSSGNSTNVSITAAVGVDPQVTPGNSLSTSIAAAGQTQRIQFLGGAGQALVFDAAFQSTSVAGTAMIVTNITPPASLGLQLGNTTIGNTISGVAPPNTSSGLLLELTAISATGSMSVFLDQTTGPTVALDGSPLSIAQGAPGKAYRISTNSLPAGQSFVVGLTGLNSTAAVYVLDSSQNYFYKFSCSPGSCNGPAVPIQTSGVATVVLVPANPAATYTASITLTTSPVVSNLNWEQETYVNITRPGQTQTFNIPTYGSNTLLNIYRVNPSQPNGDFATELVTNATGYLDRTTGAKLFFAGTPNPSTSMVITPKDTVNGTSGGDTGSVTLFLDRSVANLAMNPAGASNPTSATVSNNNPEGGVMLRFNFPGTSSAQLTLSNVSASPNQPIGVEVFYYGANGWFPSGQQQYCQSSNCSYYVPNVDFPQNNGPAVVVLYPATYPPTSSPYSLGTSGWSVIPITGYNSFTATVSVSQ